MCASSDCSLSIGVLMIDSLSLQLPGSMASDATFPYRVIRRRVPEAGARQVLRGGGSTRESFVAAAQELDVQGVALITTNCGFLVKFQADLTAAVRVPVVTSSLLLVPLIARLLPGGKRVGVLTYDSRDVSDEVLRAAGIDRATTRLGVTGVEECPSWQILWERSGEPDLAAMEGELVDLTQRMVESAPDLGALVLECAAMPPFAGALHAAVGLPVYDVRHGVNLALQGLVSG